jgi:hypothetical protein
MSSLMSLSILTEKNLNKLFQYTDIPMMIEEKLNQIKLFNIIKLINDIYSQKDLLRNDKLVTVILFDCIKIIMFIYNYQFSFNNNLLFTSFQENIDLLNVKYVSRY